jgi:histidinol-phosphate/aromatic aminotransferase/cobyric acid decarboxylase-like protein
MKGKTHSKTDTLRLHRNEPGSRAIIPADHYPETDELMEQVCVSYGVARENVIITPGADGGLDIACRSRRPGRAMFAAPDFFRYQVHAENAWHTVVRVPLGFPTAAFPTASFLELVTEQTTIVIVSTVGNPTGYLMPQELPLALRRRAPGALVVVDEVYSDFVGADHTKFAVKTPGVIALRSLSKIGFPGLRVGFIFGHRETVAALRRYASPVAVASASVNDAVAEIRMKRTWRTTIERQASARDWLAVALNERGLRTVASPANWVMTFFGDDADRVVAALGDRRVLIQNQTDAELAGWVRISTPDIDSLKAFVRALDAVWAPGYEPAVRVA